MSKVFAGVDEAIDRALAVTHVGSSLPHYSGKKAALLLSLRPPAFDACTLIGIIVEQLQHNLANSDARWRTMGGSWENWRWKKNGLYTRRDRVDEKTVEKRIALDCGDSWVNQVPTASGLLDRQGEQHCDIDLVHRVGEDEYEFIELKYDHATPLFAAFEILKYGLLFLVSRQSREEFRYTYDRSPLMWARDVHFVVLAPPHYYAPFCLKWLEEDLNVGLTTFSRPGLTFRFSFQKMPWPYDLDCAAALRRRESVYATDRQNAEAVCPR